MKKIKLILGIILFVHFFLVSINVAPQSYRRIFKPILNFYIIKLFMDEDWKMFSPPPKYNDYLLFKYSYFKNSKQNETNWLDVYTPLLDKRRSNSILYSGSSDLAYLLYNSLTSVHTNISKFRKQAIKVDTLKNDPKKIERYIYKKMEDSLGKGDKVICNYGAYLLRTESSLQNVRKADSIFISYKLICDKFPDFNHRFLHPYKGDLSKHEITSYIIEKHTPIPNEQIFQKR
jgi:hypothetical protein